MQSLERRWTKRSSYSARNEGIADGLARATTRVAARARPVNRWVAAALLALASLSVVAPASAGSAPAEPFTRALDAYFDEQPYRAIVLLHESMARSDTAPLREASLYVLGQSFASIHLYEKAEDSLSALLSQYPDGRFAPIALRELARIFFNLHEYAAVVNLEQNYRGQIQSASSSGIWSARAITCSAADSRRETR
jgi:TolA-binding protein